MQWVYVLTLKAPTTVSRRQAHTQACTRLFPACLLLPSLHSLWDCGGSSDIKGNQDENSGHFNTWRHLADNKMLTVCDVEPVTVMLFVGCSMSQECATVPQGRICSDNFTCCHTEVEAADQTFYLTQTQYTDTGPTSPSDDPITPGTWQGSRWSANF